MKKLLLFVIISVAMLMSPLMSEDGFNLSVCWLKLPSLPIVSVLHDTNPGDWFLPNSNVPGSAGRTSMGGDISYGFFGFGYEKKLTPFLFYIQAGPILGDISNTPQKNMNDIRPDSKGAYVYSNSRYGVCLETGLSYLIINDVIGIGASVQFVGIHSEWGWYRFGANEIQGQKWDWYLSAGPNVDIKIDDIRKISIGLQLKDWKPFSVKISYHLDM